MKQFSRLRNREMYLIYICVFTRKRRHKAHFAAHPIQIDKKLADFCYLALQKIEEVLAPLLTILNIRKFQSFVSEFLSMTCCTQSGNLSARLKTDIEKPTTIRLPTIAIKGECFAMPESLRIRAIGRLCFRSC